VASACGWLASQGECEQARAEQHEARRRQCEETAGNEVMISHDTPVTLDARPNLLKISESASQKELMRRLAQNFRPKNSRSGTKSFEGMGQKDTYAHQAHHGANCLDHCKHPCHPAHDRTTAALHSQKDSNGEIEDRK